MSKGNPLLQKQRSDPLDLGARVRRVDVRLAVVCYGGVSLAVYMFGTICEFRALLDAARAFDAKCEAKTQDDEAKASALAGALKGTTRVYYELLKLIREKYKLELHVILDYVSGTSAGGINGVALATSAVYGTPIESLRDTWLTKADAQVLRYTNYPTLQSLKNPSLASIGSIFLSYASSLRSLFSTDWIRKRLSSSTGVASIPQWFLEYALSAVASKFPIFDGNLFRNILREQLVNLMKRKAEDAKKSALRERDSLSLFVTATDINPFHRNIAFGLWHTKESKFGTVLRFDRYKTLDDFDDASKLAFAARATSAFPFAFQGIQLGELFNQDQTNDFVEKQFRDVSLDISYDNNAASSSTVPEKLSWFEWTKSWIPWTTKPQPDEVYRHLPLIQHEFADGGLMMNKPFLPILRALSGRRKTLGNNIQRRVVYLEPSPEAVRHKKIDKTNNQLRTGWEDIYFFDGIDVLVPEESQRYKLGVYADSLRKRHRDLEKAGASPVAEVPGVYDHIQHLGTVYNASTSQPISDQIREVDEFNAELRSVHEFMLRGYVHTQILFLRSPLPEDFETWKTVPLEQFKERISQDNAKQYCESRAMDAHSSLSDALSGRKWFYFPERTIQRVILEETIHRVGAKHMDILENPFFFRDCLTALVAVLENHAMNPLVFTTTDTQSRTDTAKRVSDRVQMTINSLDDVFAGYEAQSSDDLDKLAKFEKFFREHFHFKTKERSATGNVTRVVDVTEDEVRDVLNKCIVDEQTHQLSLPPSAANEIASQDICRALNRLAEFAFKKLSDWMAEANRLVILELIPEILDETRSDKVLMQVILQTLLGFSFFDSLTFPVISGQSLGDNAVTKVTRVSADNSKILFSETRKRIRAAGTTSIAKLLVRSTDASNFGGFFSAEARESDLIWGRLDGVEAVCNLLLESADEEVRRAANDFRVIEEDFERHASMDETTSEDATRLKRVTELLRQARPDSVPRVAPVGHERSYYTGFDTVLREEIAMRATNGWQSTANKNFFVSMRENHPGILQYADRNAN